MNEAGITSLSNLQKSFPGYFSILNWEKRIALWNHRIKIKYTKEEWELMLLLFQQENRVVEYPELICCIRQYNASADIKMVDQCMDSLIEKFTECIKRTGKFADVSVLSGAGAAYIYRVPNVGYYYSTRCERFEAGVFWSCVVDNFLPEAQPIKGFHSEALIGKRLSLLEFDAYKASCTMEFTDVYCAEADCPKRHRLYISQARIGKLNGVIEMDSKQDMIVASVLTSVSDKDKYLRITMKNDVELAIVFAEIKEVCEDADVADLRKAAGDNVDYILRDNGSGCRKIDNCQIEDSWIYAFRVDLEARTAEIVLDWVDYPLEAERICLHFAGVKVLLLNQLPFHFGESVACIDYAPEDTKSLTLHIFGKNNDQIYLSYEAFDIYMIKEVYPSCISDLLIFFRGGSSISFNYVDVDLGLFECNFLRCVANHRNETIDYSILYKEVYDAYDMIGFKNRSENEGEQIKCVDKVAAQLISTLNEKYPFFPLEIECIDGKGYRAC